MADERLEVEQDVALGFEIASQATLQSTNVGFDTDHADAGHPGFEAIPQSLTKPGLWSFAVHSLQ